MDVYLMQHGEAKPEQEDPARPLSDRGRAAVHRVAEFVFAGGRLKPVAIYHSTRARAAETARIVRGYIDPPPDIHEADGLQPLDDPLVWAGRLKAMDRDCLLAGHLPHLVKLVSVLVAGRADMPVIEFKMGGMVCLRRDAAAGFSVAWLVVPELLAS